MNHNENYTHDGIEGSSLADEGEFGLFLNEWGQHTGKDDVESPTRNPSEAATLVNDENGEISFDLNDIFKKILERTDELKEE